MLIFSFKSCWNLLVSFFIEHTNCRSLNTYDLKKKIISNILESDEIIKRLKIKNALTIKVNCLQWSLG